MDFANMVVLVDLYRLNMDSEICTSVFTILGWHLSDTTMQPQIPDLTQPLLWRWRNEVRTVQPLLPCRGMRRLLKSKQNQRKTDVKGRVVVDSV